MVSIRSIKVRWKVDLEQLDRDGHRKLSDVPPGRARGLERSDPICGVRVL